MGDSTLIDHQDLFEEFDVLGSQLVLAPPAAAVGILAAMRSSVVNLQEVTGEISSHSPYVIRVDSDYSGRNVATAIAPSSCVAHGWGLQGCVSVSSL